jgi:hypothetical protein
MGQFKPMVKMMTTEPSVILKLKKGGKVEKADGGFVPMQSTMPAGLPARGGSAPAASPMRPSLAARRRAMNPNLLMKKGGEASCEKVEKELKAHEAKSMSKAHKKAGGGKVSTFANTKMVDGDKKDKAHGTGGVKEGKPAGYKGGGNVAKFENTKVVQAKADKVKGPTGGVVEGKPAGYKSGGKVPGLTGKTVEGNEGKFTNNNVVDGDKFDPAHGTTGVRESNAGGYKKGGSTKKAYAAGGKVDDGKAVKMPKHFVSRPVANSLQSGTFKKGGKVDRKADGGLEDMSKGAYDKAVSEKPVGSGFASKVQGAIDKFFNAKKPAGTVTETKETVTTSKKNGGKC